jgi:hypothetical protein
MFLPGSRSDVMRWRTIGEGPLVQKWTSGHPWKSHLMWGLCSYHVTKKAAAFSAVDR